MALSLCAYSQPYHRHHTENVRLAQGSGVFLLDLAVDTNGRGHTPSTKVFLGSDVRHDFFGALPFFFGADVVGSST